MMMYHGNYNMFMFGCMILVTVRLLSVSMVSSFSIRQQSHHGVCQLSLLFASNQNSNNNVDIAWDTHEMTVSLLSKRNKKKNPRWKFQRTNPSPISYENVTYSYSYDELHLIHPEKRIQKTFGMILIHPIGIGIGKWYYHRLLSSLFHNYYYNQNHTTGTSTMDFNLHVISPDLVGSGTSRINPHPSNTTLTTTAATKNDIPPPLWNISDWTFQINHLITTLQQQQQSIDSWIIVANGGCSPIALQVLQQSLLQNNNITISHLLLSSIPRLSFFLPTSSSINQEKVQRSYKRLCGIIGKIFWWYSLRNNGKFIQKFSERNLVADPSNLGSTWTSNCLTTAKLNKQWNQYSTFAFLAGTLQDGCHSSLHTIISSSSYQTNPTQFGFVYGRDQRRNRAKSWFWKKQTKTQNHHSDNNNNNMTLYNYLQINGYPYLQEYYVGGRISLAHEDSDGYSKALLSLISSNATNHTTSP